MLRVRDSMTREVITLGPEASATEAWSLCREHRIRHIPVVQDGRLAGMVSDRDLRDVSPSSQDNRDAATLQWVRVGDMMTRSPVTISPFDTIDHAAREIYTRKIGCLPVVDGDELVGIVTSSDMMRALMDLVGAHGFGSWVEVEVPNEPGQLANLTDVIRNLKVNISGVFVAPASRETYRSIVLRLETGKPAGIVNTLKEAGYRVITVESTSQESVHNPFEER